LVATWIKLSNAEIRLFYPDQLFEKAELSLWSQSIQDPADVTDEMRLQAAKSVKRVKEKFGIDLDFTANHLKKIDFFCEEAHREYIKRKNSNESVAQLFDATIKIWAAYLGEVVRNVYGGKWINSLPLSDSTPVVQVGNHSFDLFAAVQNRIFKGSEHELVSYFESINKTLARYRSQQYNFENLQKAFETLSQVNAVWLIVKQKKTWEWKQNAGADSLVSRNKTRIFQEFTQRDAPAWIIRSCDEKCYISDDLQVAMELIFYQDRVIKIAINGQGIITNSEFKYSDLQVEYSTTNFIEDSAPPTDAEILKYTWRYVRVDGNRDLRYSGNRQLPILKYGELTLIISNSEKNIFLFSNPALTEMFYHSLNSYIQSNVI